jgi:hypothetical protein
MTTLSRTSWRLSPILAALLVGGACAKGQHFETWNPLIPVSRLRTIGTIAGGPQLSDIRLSVEVRESLQKAGINAVRTRGRWDKVTEAIAQICAPGSDQPVDGVLVVQYNHLVLYDCQSGKAAYEIQGAPESGGMSLPQMTKRLIKYLKGGTPPAPPQ